MQVSDTLVNIRLFYVHTMFGNEQLTLLRQTHNRNSVRFLYSEHFVTHSVCDITEELWLAVTCVTWPNSKLDYCCLYVVRLNTMKKISWGINCAGSKWVSLMHSFYFQNARSCQCNKYFFKYHLIFLISVKVIAIKYMYFVHIFFRQMVNAKYFDS